MWRITCLLIVFASFANSDPAVNFGFPSMNDEIYEQPVQMMGPGMPKTAHAKDQLQPPNRDAHRSVFSPDFDFTKFDDYLSQHQADSENNRVKRRAKRRRGSRRRMRMRTSTTAAPPPEETEAPKNQSQPAADTQGRRANEWATQQGKAKKRKKSGRSQYDTFEPPVKSWDAGFVEMPKDLYQAHLRPGVIFRIHMSEAIMKMQYRNYGEDKDESVIEADVEYLRLTRKVINDEITKFEDLKWLVGWFNNRSELIQEHMCNTRYFAVGTPPTMHTHAEEYMKRMCLFDNVYIDHIPYVVGEDGSLMAAVAPPVLHCDAATCTSVPFIDSVMFDERLGRTNVRTLTRCQASCRAHCRNDPDCLKRCSDRCLRND